MMGCRHHGAPVQEDLDDLVVVSVGSEYERGDVGGEGGRVSVQSLQNLFSVLYRCNLCLTSQLHRSPSLWMLSS